MNYFLIAILLGYFLGSFQTSYILAKFIKKIDIREYGSNNAGASNTTIVMGWKYGILVGLVDILKATGSILLVKYIYVNSGVFPPIEQDLLNFLLYLNGLFVILGHNYPFYLKFKGGKGTASLIGFLIATDFKLALIAAITIVVVTLITGYIAVGTIIMMVLFTVMTYFFGFGINALFVAIILTLLSIYKHLPNLKRIYTKEETSLKDTINKK